MKKKKQTGETPKQATREESVYRPSDKEKVAIGKYLGRHAAQSPAPRLKLAKDKAGLITIDHSDLSVAKATLSEALGTADLDFLTGILSQLGTASTDPRGVNEIDLNFLLSVIKGINSNDQIETMLAAQMAVVHMNAMKFSRSFSFNENIQQQHCTERLVNKLMRTFVSQVEALKRYRTGGEQKVTVQHVSVGEGGQAIVGNVTQAAPKQRAEDRKAEPPALTDARQEPMEILEAKSEPVPVRRTHKENNGK